MRKVENNPLFDNASTPIDVDVEDVVDDLSSSEQRTYSFKRSSRSSGKRSSRSSGKRSSRSFGKSLGKGMSFLRLTSRFARLSFIGGVFNDDDSSHMEESASGRQSHPLYSEEKISFLNDRPCDMTYGRRIALYLMKRYSWYNPRLTIMEKRKKDDDYNGDENHAALRELEEINEQLAAIPADFRSQYGYPVTHTMIQIPSLEKAWAYFEHCTLTRYIENPTTERKSKSIWIRMIRRVFCKGDAKLDKAEPGENHLPTKLYHPIFTPHNQLGDFGLGIGLYFSNLRALCILTILAGLFNMPNMVYYDSSQYSDQHPNVSPLLKGTAICTRQEWVPCETCTIGFHPRERIAPGQLVIGGNESGTSDYTLSNQTLNFVLKNDCDGATFSQGMINLATLFFIMCGLTILNCYLENMEVQYDEDEQTPQDYSIVIGNPPPDATDPEEWRQFFREKLHARVTSLTLAVNNDLLVRSLVRRREAMKKLEMMVPPGTELDMLTLSELSAKVEQGRSTWQTLVSKVIPGVPEIFGEVVVETAKVQGLAQLHYPVTNVYVIFETEADQRKVLSKLSVGRYQARNNIKSVLPERFLFRGQYVLYIREADEPDTIRWTDLNTPLREKLVLRSLTVIVTLLLITFCGYIVSLANRVAFLFAVATISVLNALFPVLAKVLTKLEPHSSESSVQTSLYLKITLFRWVNTAVIISIITPFTSYLSVGSTGLIGQIYTLFFSEITTTVLLQVSDPVGHLTRHYLAPRAKTQDGMDLNMEGQPLDIAERYTNMTKIFFLTLWFSSIYPAAFFMCAATLAINYFQDRFSLMRTWKRAPGLGNHISQFSRKYFLSLCVCVMAFMSSFFFSGFPFDNLCPNINATRPEWNGTWLLDVKNPEELTFEQVTKTIFASEGIDDPQELYLDQSNKDFFQSKKISSLTPITVQANDTNYRFCSQNYLQPSVRKKLLFLKQIRFPFVSMWQHEDDKWMTSEQELLCDIYGWASVGVLSLYFLFFLFQWIEAYFNRFRSTYEPTGKDQKINYSEVPSISAYIPEVNSRVYSYPLLAVNTDCIEDLISWTDPSRGYAFYDLTKDGEMLTERREQDTERYSAISKRMTRYSMVATKITGFNWEGLSDDSSSSDSDDDGDDELNFVQSEATIRPASAMFPLNTKKRMPKLRFSEVAYWPLTSAERNSRVRAKSM